MGVDYMLQLYHYYEKAIGPFKTLSDLSEREADRILSILRARGTTFAAKRSLDYMKQRRELEAMARELFIKKGGIPTRRAPHYMVVEPCEWLKNWYTEGLFVKIPIEEFDFLTISFTYGDMFPTFSNKIKDGKEYRKKLYLYPEILELIQKYGLPQKWNADGKFGPERYIEVQIWSDETIKKFSAKQIRISSAKWTEKLLETKFTVARGKKLSSAGMRAKYAFARRGYNL